MSTHVGQKKITVVNNDFHTCQIASSSLATHRYAEWRYPHGVIVVKKAPFLKPLFLYLESESMTSYARCKCFLESNVFLKSFGLHVTFKNDQQFVTNYGPTLETEFGCTDLGY